MGLKNFGNTIVVRPLYATIIGNVAIVGTMSLCLHFKSNTSSANPNNIAIQVDNKPALYSTNYRIKIGLDCYDYSFIVGRK